MKKEWWIVGGIGTVCAAIWTVLLLTVFEEEGTPASSEASASLMDFYAEEYGEIENTDLESTDLNISSDAAEEATAESIEDQTAIEIDSENNIQNSASIETDLDELNEAEQILRSELNIQRIQEEGLDAEDIRRIAPDQSMSIDEILELIEKLEEAEEAE